MRPVTTLKILIALSSVVIVVIYLQTLRSSRIPDEGKVYMIRDNNGNINIKNVPQEINENEEKINEAHRKPRTTFLRLESQCHCRKRKEIDIESNDEINYYLINKIIKRDNNEREYESSFKLNKEKYPLKSTTCDLYNTLRHLNKESIDRNNNEMKNGLKVIGISLYGLGYLFDGFNRYYDQLKVIVKQAKELYPDWIIRIHYDDTINKTIICDLECLEMDEASTTKNGKYYDNVDFCNMNKIPFGLDSSLNEGLTWSSTYLHKMKWRWLPMGDPYVDYLMSRDSDSWMHKRDASAVEEWLQSNNVWHIMRDSIHHSIPIIGCCWGVAPVRGRENVLSVYNKMIDPEIAKKFNQNEQSPHGHDQYFLSEHVWPEAQKNVMAHDAYYCHTMGGRPFPLQRPDHGCFVSCNYCCEPGLKYSTRPIEDCPQACRPKDHQDWNKC